MIDDDVWWWKSNFWWFLKKTSFHHQQAIINNNNNNERERESGEKSKWSSAEALRFSLWERLLVLFEPNSPCMSVYACPLQKVVRKVSGLALKRPARFSLRATTRTIILAELSYVGLRLLSLWKRKKDWLRKGTSFWWWLGTSFWWWKQLFLMMMTAAEVLAHDFDDESK
jgi:hypothetical protein